MIITGKTYDEERALYGLRNAEVSHCLFDGPADGESALKEASDVEVLDCTFRLRYPLCIRQTRAAAKQRQHEHYHHKNCCKKSFHNR